MEKQKSNQRPPQHGFINELAKLCGCNRNTVRAAIYNNARGTKSEFVRKMYRTKYAGLRDNHQPPKDYVPNCISTIDQANMVWEFVFSGKVVLTYHGETSCVEICSPDGRQEFNGITTLGQLMTLQGLAEQIAEGLQ